MNWNKIKKLLDLMDKIDAGIANKQALGPPNIAASTAISIAPPRFLIGEKAYRGKDEVLIDAVYPADPNYPNSQHQYAIIIKDFIFGDCMAIVSESDLSGIPIYQNEPWQPKCTCGSTTTYGKVDSSVHSYWCDTYSKGGLK